MQAGPQSKDRAILVFTENKLLRTWETYFRVKASFLLIQVVPYSVMKNADIYEAAWALESSCPEDRLQSTVWWQLSERSSDKRANEGRHSARKSHGKFLPENACGKFATSSLPEALPQVPRAGLRQRKWGSHWSTWYLFPVIIWTDILDSELGRESNTCTHTLQHNGNFKASNKLHVFWAVALPVWSCQILVF